MPHYDDSALRRSIDEPESVDAGLRPHVAACPQCRARLEEIEHNAAFATRLFAERAPAVDVRASYERTMEAASARVSRPRWMAGAIGVAVAACAVLALALTPLGGLATQFLTIFEPKAFVPLAISARDSEQLRAVPALQRLGTFGPQARPVEGRVASIAEVPRSLGFTPRTIGALPAGIGGRAVFFYRLPFVLTYTFSAKKARAYEAAFARDLPPMPPDLDGTTFRVDYGPMLVRAYGDAPGRLRDLGKTRGADTVFLVEARVPRVTSTGASLESAADYLLSMPDVPAGVARQLRSIADPAHTLPIPFSVEKSNATEVSVDGVTGLAVGDETGLGSIVVWQKNGMIYAVAGALRESEALALANHLE